ncbi:MAG TPA: glycoside hydrolase family 88 protein [Candidatus Eisenbergiella stercoravium]|nr:glycoside hydrolase family 88 protein [Candidatus Eisenbergiella stercoravium]
MEKILRHMLETRPEGEVEYYPYYAREGIRQRAVLRGWEIDLNRIFPKEKRGQQIFIKAFIQAQKKDKALLNLRGNCLAVYYDGRKLQPELEDDRGSCYFLEVSAKLRELILQCPLDEKNSPLEMVISTIYYRGMEARDYLNHIRILSYYHTSELEEPAVSGPYPVGMAYDRISWKQNDIISDRKSVSEVDFGKWYGQEKGRIAYAVTCCKKDGRISITPFSECRILVNGRKIKRRLSRETVPQKRGKSWKINLHKGDVLLIKSLKTPSGWGFRCEDGNEVLELPMVKRKDDSLDKFLLTGAFGKDGNMDTAFGPEHVVQWKTPYFKEDGERCFWRFNRERMYLRPYLSTSFFGQWFYALMVGNYGLLCASEMLGKTELTDYFLKSTKVLSDYYEYAKYDAAMFGEPAFLQRSVVLDNLDSIGAIGMCLAENYRRTLDGRTLSVLLALAEAAQNNIPRFVDGTYHRKDTMWADDIFMSVPFLIRMWEITGNEAYLSECFCQFRGFRKKLYMKEKGIFSHIYFLDREKANEIPWGRGNGWVFLSLADFLKKIMDHPGEHAFIKDVEDLLLFFREFAAGVIRFQDQEGMWHQILDEESSYQETSCTGMFVTGISYGVAGGFLDNACICSAREGMEALRKKAVTEDGVVRGVCRGSGCSMERKYYRELGTVEDDDHGTGIILLAMTALQEAEAVLAEHSEKNKGWEEESE